MERSPSDGRAKRLSTISEYSEPPIDSDSGDPSQRRGQDLATPANRSARGREEEAAPVEYFLVDDSPMAKFTRSVRWIYKKVSSPETFYESFRASAASLAAWNSLGNSPLLSKAPLAELLQPNL